MFPIRDENPTLRFPIVTVAIIASNFAAWFLLQGAGDGTALLDSVCKLGIIPGEITDAVIKRTIALTPNYTCTLQASPDWVTLVTSMFMHGGWMHILGNMWFLWIFGNNVEDSMGRFRFVIFYLLCGLAAAAAQIITNPSSTVPMVGASGAIGGVMGAYVVLYPRVPVHMFVILGFFITTIAVPAYLMLGFWFALQVLGGLPALGSATSGVAFWAHVGGFATGVILIFLFRNPRLVNKHREVVARLGYRYGRRDKS